MTSSIRHTTPTQLQSEYAQLRKQSVGNDRNQTRAMGVTADQNSNLPLDTVTLSSRLTGDDAPVKPKPSQPVTHAEKQVLHAQFSVYG